MTTKYIDREIVEAKPHPMKFLGDDGELHDYIPPTNKWMLQKYIKMFFGMTVADTSVCANHDAPLDAAWAAYIAEHPVIVWLGSRGFAGKTTLLSSVAIIEALDGANVNVLGGSGRQSQRIHEFSNEAWNHTHESDGIEYQPPFKILVPKEPTSWRFETIMRNRMIALTASTKSARGPHPQRLRMDEIDEMKEDVYNSAMGQTMTTHGIKDQVTLSSTQQYPDGTMAMGKSVV